MPVFARQPVGIAGAALLLAVAVPSGAQVADQLSAYTGRNATGYLRPLADAFGADLNDGLFRSARVPTSGFHLSLEIRLMAVIFEDEDRTFQATTEGVFTPVQTADVPTVVGSGQTTVIAGSNGTRFAFPGGFDLNSFAIAVPQLRIGVVGGTEGLVRFLAVDTGDAELGDLTLIGFGLRHSVSQYFGPAALLDVAVGFFWQKFTLGDDLIDARALSVGAQAGRRLGLLEPYAGLSLDTFSMDVSFTSDALGTAQPLDLDFGSDTTLHVTLGLALRLTILNLHGEYNIADKNSFALGLALGI